jgi:hypothetical protein
MFVGITTPNGFVGVFHDFAQQRLSTSGTFIETFAHQICFGGEVAWCEKIERSF